MSRCILFHFYIKPQPCLFYPVANVSCILFHFYIKPQPRRHACCNSRRLYLIPFLHQTTTIRVCLILFSGCILFHFYIKPQPLVFIRIQIIVVSYSISTSNHNSSLCSPDTTSVVSYSISTSNHNPQSASLAET